MEVLVEVTEAADRLEELIELAHRGDEIVICRDERPVARLTPIAKETFAAATLWRLAAEGRKSVPPGSTSDHSDLYDENGLPK
ncbi:type II toxin-antitoxin system Phd/YefM family antitoxin [Agrobacterium vitis]|uniref:Prevent-host-death family protein n=1 Tax=Agrobacterium vitis TaxID=373 RepID=A0A7K1R9D8_AGRVI|nr:prevent-host-death family protein [Agrobacterium vitis]MVA54731.1 prevent-host-death family protein [Agrobacterium vitis]